MRKILIISNGHGEDLVGAELAKNIPAGFETSALPLVGEGKAYENTGCAILGPRKKLPGGGFSLRNPASLFADLKAGYLGTILEQYRTIRTQKTGLVIAIGDLIPLLAAIIVKAPFVFIGVNKTDYYKWFGYNYTPWEIWLMQSAKKVFARDQLTADNLKAKGINVAYVGNPLMDTLTLSNVKCQMSDVKIIGILPGTREKDVELNLEDFEKIKEEIKKIDAVIEFKVATKENFEAVLKESGIVIGLSGTGNEQAAGMGIPVVSFPGRGSQYDKKFGEAQKQLLGEALEFIGERDFVKIAQKTLEILKNKDLSGKMGKAGMERMGGFGAVKRIAEQIAVI